ncbi:hypothetical protein JCM8097_003797 [Rhodosporidiobolus ruineniae]
MSYAAGTDNARQTRYNEHFQEWYQFVWLGVLGALIVRNFVLCIVEYFHDRRLRRETTQPRSSSFEEKASRSPTSSTIGQGYYRPSFLIRVDDWAFHPLVFGLTPVKLAFIAAVLAVNLPFLVVVSTTVKPPKSTYLNVPHAVALRAGFLALAQSPAVFALMGRNSLIAALTGISYQSLRFAHKVFASAWILLAVVHWLGMTLSNLTWAGKEGVAGLYKMYIVRFGLVCLIALILIGISSFNFFRRRQYEIWLLLHQAFAVCILVGVYHHAPALRSYTYASISLWALERLLRLLQLFSVDVLAPLRLSLTGRPKWPLVRARATLVHGAVVLRIEGRGRKWGAGQHVYVGFPAFTRVFWQTHPFSIANVPPSPLFPSSPASSSPSSTEKPLPSLPSFVSTSDKTASEEEDLLLILRVHSGLTARLARHLSVQPESTEEMWVTVEGPYGRRHSGAGRFEELVLVAGGSGITHVLSVLADALEKAKQGRSRTRRIHLIWVLQHVEQALWPLQLLLSSARLAAALSLPLSISLHPTRGPLTPQLSRTSSHAAMRAEQQPVSASQAREGGRKGSLTAEGAVEELLKVEGMPGRLRVEEGRPDVGGEVRKALTAGGGGSALVVSCGPARLTEAVRHEVVRVKGEEKGRRVELETASYEY